MSDREKPQFVSEADEQLWHKLKSTVDSRGEYGDRDTELGVVRKAVLAFPKVDAVLKIIEMVDPRDLDGPLAYDVDRHDWRGDYNFFVSRVSNIGHSAVRAIDWDLQIYTGETDESMEHRRDHDKSGLQMIDAIRRQEHGKKIEEWPEETVEEIMDRALIHGMSPADKKRLAIQLARPEQERAKPKMKWARGVLTQPPGYGYASLRPAGTSRAFEHDYHADGMMLSREDFLRGVEE